MKQLIPVLFSVLTFAANAADLQPVVTYPRLADSTNQ